MAFEAVASRPTTPPPAKTKVWVEQNGGDVRVHVGDGTVSQVLIRIRDDGTMYRAQLQVGEARRLGIKTDCGGCISDTTDD